MLILFQLGATYCRIQRWATAKDALDECVSLKPEHLEAWKRLAEACQALGKHLEEVEAWRKILELEPANVAANVPYAKALVAHGKDEAAVDALRAALKGLPVTPALLVELAKPLLRLGKYAEALETCERAQEKHANRAAKEKLGPEVIADEHAEVLLWLGRALFANGKKDAGARADQGERDAAAR